VTNNGLWMSALILVGNATLVISISVWVINLPPLQSQGPGLNPQPWTQPPPCVPAWARTMGAASAQPAHRYPLLMLQLCFEDVCECQCTLTRRHCYSLRLAPPRCADLTTQSPILPPPALHSTLSSQHTPSLTSCPSCTPLSSATRRATVRAATRRGCVTAIRPLLPASPASKRN
jgi:hypothetical protein